MTETEKAIIATVTGIGSLTIEIGRTQASMAGYLAQHLPNLEAAERQVLLNAQKFADTELQSLQRSIEHLKSVL